MKKLIRAIIKIPATPVVIVACLFAICGNQIFKFFEWAYEASDYEKEITSSIDVDAMNFLKRWFTTI
jgi:hypothetical protein